jgi:PAS domain S-box-containing protein
LKFHYADIEVAGDALTALLDALEDSGAFQRASELPSGILERHKRISWNAFCGLLALAEKELGLEEMKRTAARSLKSPRFKRRTQIARMLLTLQDAYLFFLQTRADPDFPNVSSICSVTETSVDVYAYLGDGYQPSRAFFVTMEGAFDGLRDVFGVPGEFEAEVNPTWAHYHLTVPAVPGWRGRVRSVISRTLYTLLSLPNIFRIQDVLVRRSLDLEQELIRRRRAERLLAENEAAVRRRIENIREIIFEFNRDGSLVYVSPNIEAGLGYTVDQLQSDPMAIFPAEHRHLVREALQQASPEIDFHQMNLKSRQGDNRWYELSLSTFEADQESRLLMLARDITERHQLDTETLNSQKLETLGVLAGSIAHDFNNLLVPVLGNAEMLVEDLPEDSYQHEIAVQIQRATSKASDLTNQLLLYAGDRVPVRKRVDLSAEIEQVMELMKASIPPVH